MDIPKDELNYRRYHESFMHNINGTTATETALAITPICFNIIIALSLIYFIIPSFGKPITKFQQFCIEFAILIIPTIFWTTVWASYLNTILMVAVILTLCVVAFIIKYTKHWPDLERLEFDPSRRNFITNVRSVINILTGIAILAVDFKIFPRRFAKTETFGFSLMDVGVGTYVFSSAVVTALNMQDKPRKRSNFFKNVWTTFLSCTPLFILGSVRFIVTNELDYQQQISEYGVHWNFFITLAYTKFLSTIILLLVPPRFMVVITISLCILHEFSLQAFGLQDWVMSSVRRDTFLTANREGLCSTLGYVALYFVAMQVGIFIKLKHVKTFKDNLKLLYKLLGIVFGSLILTICFDSSIGVSRRLANFGYISWITFVSITMVVIILIGELFLTAVFMKRKGGVERAEDMKLIILEGINFNGLTFFLLANVFTGLVNLSIHTLNVNVVNSLLILICYMFVVCGIMSAVYLYKIKLKFWYYCSIS